MRGHARLPRELTDIVIDDLWDDPAALKNCALVCTTWLKPAHSHLFREITLHSRELCQALYKLLEDCSRVNQYIHSLTATTAGAEEDDWAYVGDSFPRTLRMFTSLRCLTLSNDKFYGQVLWSYVSQDCKDAIMDVLQLPSMTSFTLCTWRFDTGTHDIDALLRNGRSLKSLRLEYVSYRDQVQPPTSEGSQSGDEQEPPVIELDKLSIEIQQVYRPDILSYFSEGSNQFFNLNAIRTLEVVGTRDNQDKITALLGNIGDSLRTLKLYPFDIMPNDPCVDISKNTSLRSLHIIFGPVLNARTTETDPLDWLRTLLLTIPETNALEDIEISIDLKRLLEEWSLYSSGSSLNLDATSSSALDLDATNWRSLRHILEQNKFKNLKSLSIDIHSRWHNTFLYGHLVRQEFRDLGFTVVVSPSATAVEGEDDVTP